MRMRTCFAVLGCLAISGVWASPASAESPLRWQFEKDQVRHYTMAQTTKSTAEVQGQSITTAQDINMDMTWTIKEVSSEQNATLVQVIDRIRMSMESPIGQFAFDSDNEEPIEGQFAAIGPILKALVDTPVEMTMTTRGEIVSVKVPQEMLDAVANAGPAGASMGSIFGEEGLKKMMSQSMLKFPEDALEQGKGWTEPMEVPVGPFGSMVTTRTYTLEEQNDDVARIGLSLMMELKPAEDAPVEMSIKEQESKGAIVFDTGEGFLRSSQLDQRFRMQIKVGDQTIDQEVETKVDMALTEKTATVAP